MRTGTGPVPAKIMIVGEAYGQEEERVGEAFVGESGKELNRMLHETGLLRSSCFVTNLINARPPNNDLSAWVPLKKKDITHAHVPLRDKMVLPQVKAGYQNLMREIREVKPNLIIAAGNYAMWALTGEWGVLKWRGSLLKLKPAGDLFDAWAPEDIPKVIPIIHPAAILRQWELRAITMNDLQRCKRHMDSREIVIPPWKFIIRPSYETVMETLSKLEQRVYAGLTKLTIDLETRAGHIACCGIAWDIYSALCIPFMRVGPNPDYWMEEEEADIVYRLYRLLTHPNALVDGQNILYDCQYTYRHWHFVPHVVQDTMISHHTAFAGLPKALDYQASMYCDYYVYWKDMYRTSTSKAGE